MMKKRILAAILLLAMVLSLAVVPAGATGGKPAKSRAISIAFDNSGSMYVGVNSQAWCRATYAMEVFAMMMNQGDVMQIHPMNPAYLGYNPDGSGSGKAYVHGENPLVINGPSDAGKIRDLYLDMTVDEANTPIESITSAYEGLQKLNADEKYLIVLTDGAEFYRDNKPLGPGAASKEAVEKALETCTGVNLLYLGIGNAVKPDGDNRKDKYYETADTSDAILAKLTQMCNHIFGRDEITLKGGASTLGLDVSMKKLIVFAQGEGVTSVSIGGVTQESSEKASYSEVGIRNQQTVGAKDDPTLQGMIATYGQIRAGTYNLNVSGAKSVSVYYEPDVELVLEVLDPSGNPVDPTADLYPGDYTVNYGLIDAQTKEPVDPNSSQMGDVEYAITYEHNGQSQTVSDNEAGTVTIPLGPNDTLDVEAHVEYLSGYSLDEDMSDDQWPEGGLSIKPRPVGYVELAVTGGAGEYPLAELEDLAVYDVKVLYEGTALTGTGLDNVADLSVELTGGNAKADWKPTDTGFTVYIKYNNTPDETQDGDYSLKLKTSYTNADGVTAETPLVTRNFRIVRRAVGNLELRITGGQEDYPLTKLEELAVYDVKVVENGQPLGETEFANVADLQLALTGGNAKIRFERQKDGFKIFIGYNGTAQETDLGTYSFTASTSYTNADGQTGQAQNQASFTVSDDTSDLGVSVGMEEDYYAKSSMDGAPPIYLDLTYAGAAMTAEQFEATAVEVKIAGMEEGKHYTLTPDPDNSRYILRLLESDALKTGDYSLKVTAKSADELGREISAFDEAQFSVADYPLWLVILFWVLVVLIIIIIIICIMNMKILPKQIGVGKGMFSVEGEIIPGNVRCNFGGKNRKRGFLEISSPQYVTNPLAKCGFRLELEAVSPRRTRSAARKARVIKITPLNADNTTSLTIGSWRMGKDPVSGKLIKVGGKPNTPVSFQIGNNVSTTVVAEIMDMTDGNDTICSLTVPLKFY